VQAEASGEGEGFANWSALTDTLATTASLLPFAGERPFIIQRLTPVRYGKQWWLQDDSETIMPVKENFPGIWKILALSGGQPLKMALIGKEKVFEPIGVWHGNQYKMI
jgi:hypothetical protein